MRRLRSVECIVHSAAPAAFLGAFMTLAGCWPLTEGLDCTYLLNCSSGSGGSGGSTTSSTGGNGGGGGMPGCVPSENADPVGEDCGVFVSSSLGKAGNDGLKGTPFATIQAALDAKKGTKIYVCAEEMAGSVTLSSGVTMYGGLDCHKGWVYVGGKTKSVLKGEADKPALVIGKEADGAAVEDFSIQAADAVISGGSSIGVIVEKATVTLSRCTVLAGDAKDGDAGASGGAQEMQAEGGKVGDNAGAMGTSKGGGGGVNMTCNLLGGDGGNGGPVVNGDGGDGTQGDTNQGGGKGTGQTSIAACTNGVNGDIGAFISSGLPPQGPGTLDDTGYHGADGHPGVDGTNGKSGGGGGGSKATVTEHGAGGGGGGAGGCGGKHGEGGRAGGSSLALVSLGATITLTNCKLSSGKAGQGGAGGAGQNGQLGGGAGLGGNGSGPASGCDGGKGGKGGNGGNGGGGLGGHSLGIALTGTAPTLDAATKKDVVFGLPGAGGKGGNMDVDMNHGAPGNAGTCWDFAGNKSCL